MRKNSTCFFIQEHEKQVTFTYQFNTEILSKIVNFYVWSITQAYV